MNQENINKKVLSDFRFGREIQKIANGFRRLADDNLNQEGITVSQLRVLVYISCKGKEGKVYQRDLEEDFGIRRSSVTSLLQNMEKSGILTRVSSSSDGRIKEIALTEKGRVLDERLKEYILVLEEDFLKGFSEEEKELLKDFLFRLGENLNESERNKL